MNTMALELPNLPYFIDGNVRLTDPTAIMKYIAMKWDKDLLGKTPAEQGKVEVMVAIIGDLKGAATMPCYTTGSKDQIKNATKAQLTAVSTYMMKNKYLAGDNITFIDFVMFELLELLDFVYDKMLLKTNATLNAYHQRIKALPGLSAYKTEMQAAPFNGPQAKLNNG